MKTTLPPFGYTPSKLLRELTPFYISSNDQEITEMLKFLKLKSTDELFEHIPEEIRFNNSDLKLEKNLEYNTLAEYMFSLSEKNKNRTSFIGDGLRNLKVEPIVPYVCGIRGLTTAYTPYQPERSQGTLMTLWMYASCLSEITGFEAINASLYDRSTGIYEAIQCARRINDKNITLIFNSIYPGDIEVLKTHAASTSGELVFVPYNTTTGKTDLASLKKVIEQHKDKISSVVFPQVSNLGVIEEFDAITDLCEENSLTSIAIIDPLNLCEGGLAKPSAWGTKKNGVSMIVGEGQHLAIAPNFGGPGIGIFGIRYNDKDKNSIRSSAGRFIGNAVDSDNNNCKVMVLSTREQHIRRDKATSNICSNQSFIATVIGASLLAKGSEGLTQTYKYIEATTKKCVDTLTKFKGVELAYPNSPIVNEFVLKLPIDCEEFITKAKNENLHVGVNVSSRINTNSNRYLLLSISDVHTEKELSELYSFFKKSFGESTEPAQKKNLEIPASYINREKIRIKKFSYAELKDFYDKLGEQNVSPDNNIYPLGSCTMKYNPYINDWAASLSGFTNSHPEAPESEVQGNLEVLYEIQEFFKNLTGLPAVTTQPVAGAHGELCGMKMFQAYHKHNNEDRDIVIISASAHGTNPATVSMAGIETKVGVKGLVIVEANDQGLINLDQLRSMVEKYNKRICGIMITNPNTSGLFEVDFKKISDLIHSVGGLVYMDGANMNAISGYVNLSKMGVDAVHNNLHKTWSIPHGGGGPGDGIVAVSDKLKDFLPGIQVEKVNNTFIAIKPAKSIGSIHRHYGNFAHKVRCLTYVKALGKEGTRKMSAVAVLSARYLAENLKNYFPILPANTEKTPRMHEFIITLTPEMFSKLEKAGVAKVDAIKRVGKLFLDFGMHAPTVAFPEVYGLMIEPTETFSKAELDRFIEILKTIHSIIHETPEVLKTVPHFTPIRRVDEVAANKNLKFADAVLELPKIIPNRIEPQTLGNMSLSEIRKLILEASRNKLVVN